MLPLQPDGRLRFLFSQLGYFFSEGEVRRNIVITRQSLPSLLQPGGVPPPSPHAG